MRRDARPQTPPPDPGRCHAGRLTAAVALVCVCAVGAAPRLRAAAAPDAAPPSPAMPRQTLAFLFSRDVEPYREAVEGLKESLLRTPEGRSRGHAYAFTERVVAGAEADTVGAWLRNRPPDLIVTLGTQASRMAVDHAGDTPVLFAMVANPIDNGILPRRPRAGQRVCGVTTDVDPAEQFEVLKEALPEAKRLGVIYCPQYTQATVAAGVRAAGDAGLDLVRLPVEPYRVAPAIERLYARKVDVLWTVTDPGVMVPASARKILTRTLKSDTPVIGFSPAMVRAGAVLGFGIRPRRIGRQAGDIAHALLRQGKPPADVHLVYPEDVTLHVNPTVADRLRVRLPASLPARAERTGG